MKILQLHYIRAWKNIPNHTVAFLYKKLCCPYFLRPINQYFGLDNHFNHNQMTNSQIHILWTFFQSSQNFPHLIRMSTFNALLLNICTRAPLGISQLNWLVIVPNCLAKACILNILGNSRSLSNTNITKLSIL